MNRFARVLLVSVAAFLVLVLVGIVVLNGTYYGRERVRRVALDALRGMVHGEVIVGRIDGNLLDRFFNGGAVVDFVSIGFGGLRTGIFNVADLAITCGALWLLVHTAPWRAPATPEP